MLTVVGNLGWLIRIAFAFGLAALWGSMAYYWNEMGEAGPGKPTVYGVAGLALVAGLSGLIGFVRMVTSSARVALPERTSVGLPSEPTSDFDADAVMARNLANRESTEPNSAPAPQIEAPIQPSRPQFGRRQV